MKKPLIPNDDQMTLMASMVGDIYTKMSQDLMFSMIKRIKQRGTADLEREPYLWQLEKLNQMHMLNQENINYVIEQTGIAKDIINRIIKNEGLKVYQNTFEQLAEDLGSNAKHNDVSSALASYVQQVFLDYDNYINQTLLSTNYGNNEVLKIYQGIIQETVAKVVSGVSVAEQAVNDTVMQWLDKGISSSFIDKGGNRWNIDSYARMVIDSTTARVYNDMRIRGSEELGVDTFYYSIHSASRPACAPIQARIVTKGARFYSDELGDWVESLSDHGWGKAGGCLGIHCHHYLTPFVIGVNYLPDLPDELKNLTPEQAKANGEKQAKQRAYERAIRNDKYKIQASKLLEDERRVEHYRQMLKAHNRGLNDLLKENSFLVRETVKLLKAQKELLKELAKKNKN